MSPQKCTYKENTLGLNMTRRIEGPCFFFFTRFSSYSSCGIPTNQSVGNFSVKKYTLWPGSLCLASLQKKEASPLSKASLGWMYEGQERRTFCFSLGELGWDILCGSHGLSESKKD